MQLRANRPTAGVTAGLVSLLGLGLGAAVPGTAGASGAGAGQPLSAVAASSWQTNGIVWSLAYANGAIYVGGDFTSVRPPGSASGTNEVPRQHIAAFSASDGSLLPFTHNVDASVTALTASPDGSEIYAGGSFKHVDGAVRNYLAAFDTTGGALNTTWAPSAGASVLALAATNNAVYIGGNFGAIMGVSRTKAAAVTPVGTTPTTVLPFNPKLDGSVAALAVSGDGSRVLLGGYFNTLDGVSQRGIGSVDPATGGYEPWGATIIHNQSGCSSAVKNIVTDGNTAYVAVEGTGGGCFDGDFAANISDGHLIWQNDCLGATQSVAVVNGWLYKGSHAHDCSYAAGGFEQVNQAGSGWVAHRLLNQSLVDGSLGHWTPGTNGNTLGPRVMATDGTQLFVGGDFSTVNSKPQQGFARFTPTPDVTAPGRPAAPTAVSTAAGVASVSFPAVSDSDDGTLTYSIFRDSSSTAIGTVTATSWPWALPWLHYRDAGLTPGSTHTYKVRASDGANASATSAASASVTIASSNPPASYGQTVLNGNPTFYWGLDEQSGSTAHDSSPNGVPGTYTGGVNPGQPGAITGTSGDSAVGLDGQTGLVTSNAQMLGPQTFSIEAWFKTTTNVGGKIIGFGDQPTGMSNSYDRHVYMTNDGHLKFGVWTGRTDIVESGNSYNDGQWHYLVATLDPTAGMAMYVDGRLVGTNSTTTAQVYTGYWRVGGDNLNGWGNANWPNNSQGLTAPNSYYFSGTVDDVAVYSSALTASSIQAHYAANVLSH